MTGGIEGLNALEIVAEATAGRISPVEIAGTFLDAIRSKDGMVGAFIEVFAEEALERARTLEEEGPEGRPLFGLPVAVKDNICTAHLPTTCASRILAGYRPPYDATAVRRLVDAGAVVIGKTNLDEFAMGSSTEHSCFGITRNPWDTDRVPGGSSGGSAAAVAAGMVPAALGSDTGGSIRQPAAFCGVTGLKGTYGRVSRYGLVAFASSFDQIGPIAADVSSCAALLAVMSGGDGMDSTAIEEPVSFEDLPGPAAHGGMRIAIPAGRSRWDLDPAVDSAMDAAAGILEGGDAVLEEVALPDMESAIACYYVLANAEASSNLARFDGVRYGHRAENGTLASMYGRTRTEGFGEEVKRRILLGTFVLSSGYHDEYYARAAEARRRISLEYGRIFSAFDVLLLPSTPGTAFPIGERKEDPVAMYLSDLFTTPANLAQLPAISLPAGLSPDGLPVGVQLVAAPGRERDVIAAARFLEEHLEFRERSVPREGGSP